MIRSLKCISKSDPAAQMEVVLYGKSLDMVVANRSTVAADVRKLAMNKNIAFKVCEIAMRNQHNLFKVIGYTIAFECFVTCCANSEMLKVTSKLSVNPVTPELYRCLFCRKKEGCTMQHP